jgi:hypothetical protein
VSTSAYGSSAAIWYPTTRASTRFQVGTDVIVRSPPGGVRESREDSKTGVHGANASECALASDYSRRIATSQSPLAARGKAGARDGDAREA